MTDASRSVAVESSAFERSLRSAAVVVFIGTLIWSPFPLGGAIRWAAGVQEILIAISWTLWVLGTARSPVLDRRYRRLVLFPTILFGLTLAWAIVQIVPAVPPYWAHPVWGMASDVLERPIAGTISLNPWRTEGEILKLASYVLAGALVFKMARRADTAKLLLNSLIAITAFYALYAFVLAFAGVEQVNVFYAVPYTNPLISGPFMLHNSFATYCGLGALAAVAKLVTEASRVIQADRGIRRLIETTLHYCFGTGSLLVLAVLLTFAGVIASASRAGAVATLSGLIAMALVTLATTRVRTTRNWAGLAAFCAALPILTILILNGDTLGSRINQLLASDTGDVIRFSLWSSTWRMITDSPLLGLGLGTFEDAYPLYAVQIFPHVMDKAHSDYLEFAAGLGIPAACAWWGALVWLWVANLRAVFVRHRHRTFSIVAVGAVILVGVHSSVDFSLQMPAVALVFATVLALGTAQCLSSRHS